MPRRRADALISQFWPSDNRYGSTSVNSNFSLTRNQCFEYRFLPWGATCTRPVLDIKRAIAEQGRREQLNPQHAGKAGEAGRV